MPKYCWYIFDHVHIESVTYYFPIRYCLHYHEPCEGYLSVVDYIMNLFNLDTSLMQSAVTGMHM